jgi:hypothetical protein
LAREEAATSTFKGGRAMRFGNRAKSAAAAAFVAAAMSLTVAGDALAWSGFHDHIYADSFGNLVIQSPNGYKRIIVGQGHLAKSLQKYEGVSDAAVYPDQSSDGAYDNSGYPEYGDCYRPPHLWKGRSYMYGLPDGEIPQAPCAGE